MAKFSFALVLIAGCIAAVAIIQLRQENTALRQQARQMTRVSMDNQRLSNSLAQLRLAQADTRSHFQELVRLRAEIKRLQGQQSNSVALARVEEQQRELGRLQAEVLRLVQENTEVEEMREEIRQLQAAAAAAQEQAADSGQAQQPAPDQPLALRTIATQGDPFADKLKRSVGASDEESFQEVFGRFLQVNGVATNAVAAAAYDARTGRIIVRAPETTLDQIERLTSALDRSP